MASYTQEDAQLLWDDVLDLVTEKGAAPSFIEMLRSCVPERLDDEHLYVSCSMRFVTQKVNEQGALLNECLQGASFQPLTLVVESAKRNPERRIDTNSHLSHEQIDSWNTATGNAPVAAAPVVEETHHPVRNALLDENYEPDSKLTFDRFIEGDGNSMALQAAKQVANGENKTYNPLFIYGHSGLGKTHLLRAIQNYVLVNDPSRLCVYRTGSEFVDEYTKAMASDNRQAAADALTSNYHNIDILIIDDIQQMTHAQRTIDFFFNIFNHLSSVGKQIVLAADRSPAELGQTADALDERMTSRFDSGVTLSVQAPNYELKYALIDNFCTTMREDALREGVSGVDAIIPDDCKKVMAERAGTNIRTIEGFCYLCLMRAHQLQQKGDDLTEADIVRIAREKWPTGQKIITTEQIQKAVEKYYGVNHNDLVGNKRNKELMEPRHVAIWLTREYTDNTLADIGKKFGGRSHATVKHSIRVVEENKKEDRLFVDRIATIEEQLVDQV